MNTIKRIVLSILIRILDSSLAVDYKKIDKDALEVWAFRSFDDKGWRSYFAYEDMKILKEMSFGKDRDAYLVLIGRRLQLLFLFDEMRKAVELRKARSEKEKAKAEQEQKNGS